MKKTAVTKNEENISLSARSSVFLAGLIATGAALITRSEDILTMSLCVVAQLAVWAGLMIFWQRASTKHLNLFVNVLVVFICLFAAKMLDADVDPGEYIYLMPLAAGLTALGSETGDEETGSGRIDPVKELIIPVALSLASLAPAAAVCVPADRKITSVAVIVSALTLILMAALGSYSTGRKVSFSSPALGDYAGMPSASMENVRGFLLARLFFAIGIIPALAAAYGGRKLYDIYLDDNDRMLLIIPLFVLAVMTLVAFGTEKFLSRDGGRYGKYCIYEAIAAAAMISLPFIKNDRLGSHGVKTALLLVFYVLAVIMADIIATGYLTTYKRRSIFSERPAPADGLPLMLIVGGIAIMCVEGITLL